MHLAARSITAQRYICTGVGIVLSIIGLLSLGATLRYLITFPSDFTQDYMAARALMEGRSIYADYTRWLPRFMPQANLQAETPYQNFHPPFNALLFVPLALLPYHNAVLLWTMITTGLYLLLIWLVLRELGVLVRTEWWVLLLGVGLNWYPFQHHVALAQISLLLIACVLGCWALLRHERDGLGGLLLGLACLIKLYPGLLLVYLLLARRWRATGVASATFIGGMLLCIAIVGPADVWYYQQHIAPKNIALYGGFPNNLSFTGVFTRLLVDGLWVRPLIDAPVLATLGVGLCSAGLLLLLGYAAWRLRAAPDGHDRSFALVSIAMLLISPISWGHAFPVLLLPLGLVLRDVLARVQFRVPLAVLLMLVLVSLPDVELNRWLIEAFAPARAPWYVGVLMTGPTLGLGLLFVLIAWPMLIRHTPPLNG